MIMPIKELSVKVYGVDGKFRAFSNLMHIAKRKVKNAKVDLVGVRIGVFDWKASPYKDGYKMSKNPINYK